MKEMRLLIQLGVATTKCGYLNSYIENEPRSIKFYNHLLP